MSKQRRFIHRRGGIAVLIIIFIVLMSGLIALAAKVRHDLNTPFKYRISVTDAKDSGSKSGKTADSDGSVSSKDEFGYVVDISKHWQNNPDTPLMTYGAQYDKTVVNESDYDIVDWNVVIYVP